MSRIALIYPKLKVFRNNRKNLSSISLNFPTIKNQQDVNSISSVAFSTLNGGIHQVLQPRNYSTRSAPSSPMGTKPASELIQRDLYLLAAKALAELLESKNGSNLVAEVTYYIMYILLYTFFLDCFFALYVYGARPRQSLPTQTQV